VAGGKRDMTQNQPIFISQLQGLFLPVLHFIKILFSRLFSDKTFHSCYFCSPTETAGTICLFSLLSAGVSQEEKGGEMDYITLLNLVLSTIIIALGVKRYAQSGVKAFIFIGLGFFMVGISQEQAFSVANPETCQTL
jgi:hypothetical protein